MMFRKSGILILGTLVLLSCSTPGYGPRANRAPQSLNISGKPFGLHPDILSKAHRLELHQKSKAGRGKIDLTTQNYVVRPDGTARVAGTEAFLASQFSESPEQAMALNLFLTEAHARYGMSFAKYTPDHGKEFFAPHVQSRWAFITEKEGRDTTASTAPLMRAYREVLQALYSVPKDRWSEVLERIKGLEGPETRADRERLLQVFNESIYYESALQGAVMKDYPFLPVAGFDAPMGRIGQFFESNLGTPSGLSNLIQLIELFRLKSPEQFELIRPLLVKDKTFENLKTAIEDCASKWTGESDGISVIIGPGPGNGAHPDVAAISEFSGMPMVSSHDLYIDSKGWVRMRTAQPEKDPVVTGIYSRREESFLLADRESGVGLKSPDQASINARISKKRGIPLEAGLIYEYVLDSKGEPVDVVLEKGQPKVLEIWDGVLGPPPVGVQSSTEVRTLAQAIKGRKLFVSCVGGRVVDDKRVFETLSRTAAPHFLREGETLIARPPETIRPQDYAKRLYPMSEKDLEMVVIKEPDNSGGVGVHLLVNMDPAKRKEIVELVKKSPDRYEVQLFADIMSLIGTYKDSAQGVFRYGSLSNDIRKFVFMDASGEVESGSAGNLFRVASFGSSSTNTSQGAGYGLVGEIRDPNSNAEVYSRGESVLPRPAQHSFLTLAQREGLETWGYSLNFILRELEFGRSISGATADTFFNLHRELMPVLGRKYSPMMTLVYDFKEGKVGAEALLKELSAFRDQLLSDLKFPSAVTARVLRGVVRPSTEELKKWFKLAAFDEPRDTGIRLQVGRKSFSKVELGTLSFDRHNLEQMAKVEADLRDAGGEIRQVSLWEGGRPAPQLWSNAAFLISETGKPVLQMDPLAPGAFQGMMHEYRHFLTWKDYRDQWLRKNTKPPLILASSESLELAASKAAFARLRKETRKSEQQAMGAETLRPQGAEQVFSSALGKVPRAYYEKDFLQKALYPLVLELDYELSHKNLTKAKLILSEVLIRASVIKKRSLERLRRQVEDWSKIRSGGAQEAARKVEKEAQMFSQLSLFDLVFSADNLDLFASSGNQQALLDLYRDVGLLFSREIVRFDSPVETWRGLPQEQQQ